MKRTFALIAAIATHVGFVATSAAQEGTLKKIKDSGSITIGHRDASVPFSYIDDKQQAVGYSLDLCSKIIGAIKRELKMSVIETKYQLITSANRIPLMANGTIDLECGSTTNNLSRQEQVWFSNTTYVTANRFVTRKDSKIGKLADLKGKTIVSTAGTTNIKQITEINAAQNLGMNILSANGHPEAFRMVETGRAVAFVMDDILLYGLVAQSPSPKDYVISSEAFSIEPYGLMVRKGDTPFKKVVDDALVQIFQSGEINAIYDKWFNKPIPPRGVNLALPMGPQLKKVIAKPTSSGDPNDYK
jgi:glutamate/aspartate transport system substrate-binding protein